MSMSWQRFWDAGLGLFFAYDLSSYAIRGVPQVSYYLKSYLGEN